MSRLPRVFTHVSSLHTLLSPVCNLHMQVEAEGAADARSGESGGGQQP